MLCKHQGTQAKGKGSAKGFNVFPRPLPSSRAFDRVETARLTTSMSELRLGLLPSLAVGTASRLTGCLRNRARFVGCLCV